jgi:hypothetical protein
VVCSGFDRFQAISGKVDFFRINQLGLGGRPEKLLPLIRNQQVAGSSPAGGSN